MKKIIAIIIVVFSTITVHSKESPLYYLGGSIYGNYNIHWANFQKLGEIPNCCPDFDAGTAFGFSAALLFEYPILEGLNFGSKLTLSTLDGLLSKNEYIGNQLVFRNGLETTIPVWVDHDIDASILTAGLEPYISYKFFGLINSTFGINLSYQAISQFDQKETITEPNNVVFAPDYSLIRNEFNNEEMPGKQSLLFFGVFGLGYDIWLNDNVILTPEIRYNLPFNNLGEEDWKVSSWNFGASLKIPIYPEKELPIQYDTLFVRDTTILAGFDYQQERLYLDERNLSFDETETDDVVIHQTTVNEKYIWEKPEQYVLDNKIAAYGITEDGEKTESPQLIIEEIEYEEGFPILPYVFFNEGSADLSQTEMNLLDQDKTLKFNEKFLNWKTLELYKNMLNIIAVRLKMNQNSSLSIVGCNSDFGVETKNDVLSKNRAKAVESYFTDIWGISKSRIRTRWQNLPDIPGNSEEVDGRIENQRVEIYSNDYKIIQPLFLKDVIKKSNPPFVALYPDYNSEAGLKSYKIKVSQGDNELRSFSGAKPPEELFWEVEQEPIPLTEEFINIDFEVQDKYDQNSIAKDSLTLKQLTVKKKRYEMKEDTRIERFFLILFEYNSASLKSQHIKVLDDIRSRIMPASKVTINGYTDRIGDPEYNKDLANRRCNEVQKYLKVKNRNLTINPIGADKLIYDNDIPQGRSFSRTVEVVIETPVK